MKLKTLEKSLRDMFTVNCIISPVKGAQLFDNIPLPLGLGETTVRAYLLGWCAARSVQPAKVSMCVYSDSNGGKLPADGGSLSWYDKANGKLYFNQDLLNT